MAGDVGTIEGRRLRAAPLDAFFGHRRARARGAHHPTRAAFVRRP
ncbi:hypothetical protein EV386_1264 [Xylanimonas ulmi]|uniref:Uncharacterized protein n=1 Tax=Xylanimonas ulmi TaxID=228973 RepID=A0A4Q7M201_9MICO|nr:hypothetical protein EV386_1264 [Xylanibacterium ulmi]